jgi:hypothetical protein
MSKLAAEEMVAQAPYQQTAQAAVAALTSDAERGLSSAEARGPLAQYGPNEIQSQAAAPW